MANALNLTDTSLFRESCYIDGAWQDADSGDTIEVTNPASGKVLGTVPKMGADETRRAIEAANVAYPSWRAKTAKERAAILRKWSDLMMENQEDLATLMTAEQGKPFKESMGEISYAASFIEWSPKRASGFTATRSRSMPRASESSSPRNLSVFARRSRRGIFRPP